MQRVPEQRDTINFVLNNLDQCNLQQKLHELAFGTAAKRAKVDAAAAKAVVTTKQANLAKAAKGTKSIASFFGAKKKK